MGSDRFVFKQFEILQSQSAMKVGTDGVMLGAWAGRGSEGVSRILDIGSGTGLIALMLAQRFAESNVVGVEIEPRAAQEAKANIERSPWADRLEIKHQSFQDYASTTSESYELIVSNPPYFNGTYKASGKERTAARHEDTLCSEDLLEGVIRLLDREKGRFAVIFPNEIGAAFIAKAAIKGLFCNKICQVIPKEGGAIKRLMMEFSFSSKEIEEESLVISNHKGEYTTKYKKLTESFYLRF